MIHSEELVLRNLEDNPGILPFKLGTARVFNYYRSFIHYYDLTDIVVQIKIINDHYNRLKVNVAVNLHSDYSEEIQNYENVLKFQIEHAKSKLDNILMLRSENLRTKRGLINGLGSVIKFITGNLDDNDAKRYDAILDELHKNQDNIISATNEQISLTKDIIHNFKETIQLLISNDKKINEKINEIGSNLRNFVYEFRHVLFIKNVFDQLNSNLNIVIQLLQDLENAITFAKLGIPHNSIIKRKEFNFILGNLFKDIPEDQLLFPLSNTSKYFETVYVKSYISKNRLVFVLSIPIVLPKIFNYYHLFSVPVIQSGNNYKMLIPAQPYFVADAQSYMYVNDLCDDVGGIYFCKQNNLVREVPKADCVFEMLKLSNHYEECKLTNAFIENNIVTRIDESNYILVLVKHTKVQVKCGRNELQNLIGTYFAKIPIECLLIINDVVYKNLGKQYTQEALFFPKLNISQDVSFSDVNEVKLDHVNLDKLQSLKERTECYQILND